MTRFWERRQETDLELRLRAERPEAPERLVRMLAEPSRASVRPRLVPRLAVVGAVTAVMLAALGAVGTTGYAATALSSFNASVRHVVHTSPTSSTKAPSNAQHRNAKAKGGKNGMSDGHNGGGGNGDGHHGDPGHESPWQDQYHHQWPICHRGHTLYLPRPAFTAHLMHGDRLGECPHAASH